MVTNNTTEPPKTKRRRTNRPDTVMFPSESHRLAWSLAGAYAGGPEALVDTVHFLETSTWTAGQMDAASRGTLKKSEMPRNFLDVMGCMGFVARISNHPGRRKMARIFQERTRQFYVNAGWSEEDAKWMLANL